MPAVVEPNATRYGIPGRTRGHCASGDAFREFSATISRAQEMAAISEPEWRHPDGVCDSYLDDAVLSRIPADFILAEIDRKFSYRRRLAVAFRLMAMVVLVGLIATPALTG